MKDITNFSHGFASEMLELTLTDNKFVLRVEAFWVEKNVIDGSDGFRNLKSGR
jgi:hypothetical protein